MDIGSFKIQLYNPRTVINIKCCHVFRGFKCQPYVLSFWATWLPSLCVAPGRLHAYSSQKKIVMFSHQTKAESCLYVKNSTQNFNAFTHGIWHTQLLRSRSIFTRTNLEELHVFHCEGRILLALFGDHIFQSGDWKKRIQLSVGSFLKNQFRILETIWN